MSIYRIFWIPERKIKAINNNAHWTFSSKTCLEKIVIYHLQKCVPQTNRSYRESALTLLSGHDFDRVGASSRLPCWVLVSACQLAFHQFFPPSWLVEFVSRHLKQNAVFLKKRIPERDTCAPWLTREDIVMWEAYLGLGWPYMMIQVDLKKFNRLSTSPIQTAYNNKVKII